MFQELVKYYGFAQLRTSENITDWLIRKNSRVAPENFVVECGKELGGHGLGRVLQDFVSGKASNMLGSIFAAQRRWTGWHLDGLHPRRAVFIGVLPQEKKKFKIRLK